MLYLICYITGMLIGIMGFSTGYFMLRWMPVLREYRTSEPADEKTADKLRKTPEEQLADMLNWRPGAMEDENA